MTITRLENGRYYLGGFSTNGDVFRIWEYNPDNGQVTYKGYFDSSSGSGAINGDMAFDRAGNLFVVRGSGTTTTVFSITKANLDSASGGQITVAESNSVTGTTNNVNGVAFDSDGKGYLGAASNVDRYDMPGWTGKTSHTSSLSDSTDLASCSSPPTIVIEKEVIGGRAKPGDQFKLTLKQGNTTLGEATTSGSATGLQEQRIGPLPTVRNVELTFSEVGSGTTNLSDYASAYQCTVTHRDGTVQSLQEVNGTSGSITIPATGEAVRCVFRNSPLVANVNIHKDVVDVGGTKTSGQGWTVGAAATATGGTVTSDPSNSSQSTNASGDASWKLTFDKSTSRATVSVSEVMKPGYAFDSGECVVTKLNGDETTTTLTGPDATALENVAPGDRVDCVYTNKQLPGEVVWSKVDDDSEPLGGSKWKITGPGFPAAGTEFKDCIEDSADACTDLDKDPEAGKFRLEGLAWGTYTVTETEPPVGYDGAAQFTFTVDASTAGTVITADGNPFVNVMIPDATVTLGKEVLYVNAQAPQPASGWEVGASLATGSSDGSHITGPASKQTGASGKADPWTISFDKTSDRAKVQVTETQQTGYDFDSGTCTITPLVGESSTVSIEGNPTKVLDNIKPGDKVDCTFTNEQKPSVVVWSKMDDQDPAQFLGGSEWTITGPGFPAEGTVITDCVAASSDDCGGLDKDPDAGQFRLENLAWGIYTVTESKVPQGHTGSGSFSFTVDAGNAGTEITVDGDPFVNERKPGIVSWSKVDDQDPAQFLGGSEWTITGPGFPAEGTVITDCVAASSDDCGGLDKDPDAGQFRLENLAWGIYTVTESKVPQGHTGSGSFSFTVDAGNAGTEIKVDGDPFVNERKPGIVSWSKVDSLDGALLAGSVWTLEGPGVPAGTTVSDCDGGPCDSGAFKDQDPAAGKFRLVGLVWGEYTLTESVTPEGYTGNKVFTFTVDAGNAGSEIDLGSAENVRKPGEVVWSKVDSLDGALLAGSVWTLEGPGVPAGTTVSDCDGGPCDSGAFKDQDPAAGKFRLVGLVWGEYTLTESVTPEGYTGSKVFTFTVDAGNAGSEIDLGSAENVRKPGEVVWSKIDDQQPANPLGGSEWTITGPGFASPGTVITDCVAASSAECDGLDKDPLVGKFNLKNLEWGTYTVTETKPPVGYDGNAEFTFIVGASNAGTVITVEGDPFVNAKIPDATVTLGKEVLYVNAEAPQPAAGWEVGASLATGSSAGLHVTGPALKQTGASGEADPWTISFDEVSDEANVEVLETEQAGYRFVGGTCTITPLEGESSTVIIEGTSPIKVLSSIKPGYKVDCTFTNEQKPGAAIWAKRDATSAELVGGSEWKITGPGAPEPDGVVVTDCISDPCPTGLFKDKDPEAGQFRLENLEWGTYTVTETKAPQGYVLSDPANSFVFTVDADNVGETIENIAAQMNTRIPGTVTWVKVDVNENRLAGSKWTIKGPDATDGIEVLDCVEPGECLTGPFTDQDPDPGKFRLEGLAWGDYVLVETTPPPGYVADSTPHDFTIASDHLDHEFTEPFVNEQREGPTLPLTGGIGRDHIYLAGMFTLLLAMAAYGTARVRGRRNPHGA